MDSKDWLSAQNILMAILIVATIYFGYENQAIQEENMRLQKSIYRPKLVPLDMPQPLEIKDRAHVQVGISNVGYTTGVYSIFIHSNSFSFYSEKFGSGKDVKIENYALQNGKEDAYELTILPSIDPKPINASFNVLYRGENGFETNRVYCYQLSAASAYVKVGCA